ncbi:hypothetical protein RMCBS344292_15362 [Rhizopus microsporus]|nr:hypothetical protein RMCBS344292_15362 [Rhizopus microsporus]
MAEEGTIPSSAMEANTEGHKEITGRQDWKGSDDHPNTEEPILVANGYKSEYRQSDKDPTEQGMVSDRMAITRAFQANKGIGDSIIEFLKESNRPSTRKNYDQTWARWSAWCKSQNPQYNPTEYSPEHLVEYLTYKKTPSYSSLNIIRSAIASVYRVIHLHRPPIASDQLVIQYFEARRRKEEKLPNSTQEIYDVKVLLQATLSWGSTSELTMSKLQLKTLTLLTIATTWRQRSDMGTLQFREVKFQMKEGVEDEPLGVTLTARNLKELRPKQSKLGAIENRVACPAHTLWTFYTFTKDHRNHLSQDLALFLTNMTQDNPNTWQSIKPATVASWLKGVMDEAGIGTDRFTVHSIRPASSTKAVTMGSEIDQVKMHANWSLKSNTFENYYYKPHDQHKRGREMANKLFGDATENRTTPEVGVEPTTIVVGMTFYIFGGDNSI